MNDKMCVVGAAVVARMLARLQNHGTALRVYKGGYIEGKQELTCSLSLQTGSYLFTLWSAMRWVWCHARLNLLPWFNRAATNC